MLNVSHYEILPTHAVYVNSSCPNTAEGRGVIDITDNSSAINK